MPRPRAHHPLHSAVDGLVGAMNGLLDTLGAAGPHLPVELRHAPGVVPTNKAGFAATKQRGPGKGNPRLKNALKKSWAAYTPKERAERLRKMLAGRGLRPMSAAAGKPGAKRRAKSPAAIHADKAKQTRRKPGGGWAAMSPEQRAERVAKMQAGRSRGASKVASPAREESLLTD